MVAAAPISRHTSPARSAGSPRFAAASPAAKQPSSPTQPPDRRDALSRSARRSRAIEGVSDEILHRSSARHNRNLSEVHLAAAAAAVCQNASTPFDENDAGASPTNRLPPKLPPNPRTRFQEKAPGDVPPRRSLGIPPPSSRTPDIPPRRSFRSPSPPSPTHLPLENAADPPLRRIFRIPAPLSVPPSPIPPENSSEVTPRRRFSSLSPSSRPPSPIPREIAPNLSPPLSPPRILNESALRRSYSADKLSTPLISVSLCPKPGAEIEPEEDVMQINSFLTRQRAMITRVSEGQVSSKAKIVLSSYCPNTSSMVAAICYAWLLENTREKKWVKEEVVVPVINMRREMMWEHRQAAWLFHHIGIDASALMFSDELDFEGLLMGKQLSLHVVGQDVLQTNGEVGSLCTVLTDNYCEDAYSLLQAPNLKKLLLAGILLETRNLNNVAKRNRDVEAVQLLLVGSSPNYRDFFFEQVMKEHEEDYFLEALRQHYGRPSSEVQQMASKAPAAGRAVAAQPVPGPPPALFKATERSCRPKNKFSVGKLFGFSSK
ncbi:hypothetical protein KSP39_PZI006448 [Platanthera zijinensis]|uniref:Exopolyphosphatase n=1 Tax=Platanthera zijinensis TaxID=2320716 RepID=A0AAP0GA76_9ASPA